MRLPNVPYSDGIVKYKQMKFEGLDHNLGAGDGKIWDMVNMTGDYYPLIAVRHQRYLLTKLENPGGIFARNELCWVANGEFYYNGEAKGEVAQGEKVFTAIGRRIVILPDKCYYDIETDSFGSLEAHWTGQKVTFCDGVLYDEEASANCLRAEGADWEAAGFRVGDAIVISGCAVREENNKTDIIRAIDGDKLYFYEEAFSLPEEADSYSEEGQIRVERTVPDLLYVCEHDNRLWGCTTDTIYCSKLGDIFNWNVYEGLDSDAWAITPASPGEFTGCAAYGNYPHFFKEDHLYKIYGSAPSGFSCVDCASTGVAAGSGGSLAVAGETLFWLSPNGVVACSGGIPQQIGEDLGRKRFGNGVAVSDGVKYYISMRDELGVWWLYVYDTRLNRWYKEDDKRITHGVKLGRCVYMLDSEGCVWICGDRVEMPEGATPEAQVEWMMETTDFTANDPNKKHAGKVQIRLELDDGAVAQVWMQCDSDGVWYPVGSPMGTGVKRSYYLPIKPRRCDHYRLRISGKGDALIHSITREVAPGSEYETNIRR